MIGKLSPIVRLQLYYKLITLLCEVAGHQLLVSVRSLLCWLLTLLLHSTDLDSKMAGNSFGGAQPLLPHHTTHHCWTRI